MTPIDTDTTLDLYREVHKGIRRTLFALCDAAGSLAPDDKNARHDFVARFAELDRLLTMHHEHEDGEFLGELVARVAPELAGEVHAAHETIVGHLAELRRAVIALGDGGGDVDDLYDRMASFVVDYLAHMAFEEHRVMTALAARATFDELMAVQIGIRSTMLPGDMVVFMRAMLPAMNADERTNMLGQMKAGAPPEIFDLFWSTAREALPDTQLRNVAARLGF
jgi:hypothetical protein